MIEITYLGHSGFSVHTDDLFLIFDYIGEGFSLPDGGEKIYAFVSHSHGDHYGAQVKKWKSENRLKLIGGFDVDGASLILRPGENFSENGLQVTAYPSTDEGVSFMVRAEDTTLFHAGDLNFWHWKDESTEAEIREAEALFESALKTLKGQAIDVAFFPVDPRIGTDYDEGALRFAQVLRPKLFIPMHFTGAENAAVEFSKKKMPDGVAVRAMTVPGEKLSYHN